jgi:hypothetical protein
MNTTTLETPEPIIPTLNEVEEWRDLPDLEELKPFVGAYQISSFGSVRSLDRAAHFREGRCRPHEKKLKGKVLKLGVRGDLSRQAYYFAQLANASLAAIGDRHRKKVRSFSVHRLVAFAFEVDGYDLYISEPQKYNTVDHLDRNTLNNYYKNLRFLSYSEQKLHTGMHKNNESGFKGVIYDKRGTHRNKPYTWRFSFNKERYSGKYYSTPVEAAMMRDKALIALEEKGKIRPNIISLNFSKELLSKEEDQQLTFELVVM